MLAYNIFIFMYGHVYVHHAHIIKGVLKVLKVILILIS